MVAAVASPSSAAPSAGRPHPTYKEMIMQALTELRDPSGSSRSAIATYIADHFSGLHSRHDALLSVHLRSLKSHGQLRLVSGNYFVSTAAQRQGRGSNIPPNPNPAPGQKRGRGRPRKYADSAPSASIPAFQDAKRGRGRPRKRKSAQDPVASSPSPSPLQGASVPPPPSGVKRGRGRPRKDALVPPPSSSSPLLGGIDPPPPSGIKTGRARPRKALVPVRSSFSELLGAVVLPPPSGVKRGRGRPRKSAYPAVAPLVGAEKGPAGGQPQRNTTPLSPTPATMSHSGKSETVRLPKVAVDISALRGSSMNISASSNSLVGAKRGRGRPPKVVVAGKEKMQPESVQSVDASLTKRGRGRPRKEKTSETGDLKVAQMTEGRHEALPAQAVDQTGPVQNEVEAMILQSLATTPLMEKRSRGRPRKRPLETETAETQVAASVEKRGRGRPRKKNPSAGWSAGTRDTALKGIKRGPGRPRKARPFETESVKTALEVSRDLTEDGPQKDGDLVSGKKADTHGVVW
uniref:H15 domain-containing protein n=1 Tax=Zea mays TaxID=4577 RepID=A0A804PWG7_MAIZE